MQLTSREAVMAQAAANIRRTTSSGNRLGERLRQLRVAAGLTQTDLAGDRFSKEYVSQIERGKTRPTRETIEWLAQKLGVDPNYLERGVSSDERRRVETLLARAEALTESHQYEAAIEEFENSKTAVLATGVTELEVRHLAGDAWARMEHGNVKAAIELLNRARMLAEAPEFSDVDRADVLFRLGVCRYQVSSIATAIGLLNEALTLAEESQLP
jgi:transcriptional regulator with XRE-family HTH domain